MGWGSSQTHKGSRSPQALPSFQALAGASSLGLGSSPSPPPCPGQAPVQPLLALPSGGACPIPPPSPCSTGLGGRALLFQGLQEVPLAPWTVCRGLGRGRGRGAGQGRRGGNSSPGEPKTGLCLTPGATPAPSQPALPALGRPAAFPAFPSPSPALP